LIKLETQPHVLVTENSLLCWRLSTHAAARITQHKITSMSTGSHHLSGVFSPPTAGDGGDANLPSVLQDNPNIAAQWRSLLMAALFDPVNINTSSSGSSGGLGLARAAAAACYLLLQDRVGDAEELLSGVNLEAAAAGLAEHDPLRMQVQAVS
jgi:hypothetical protein